MKPAASLLAVAMNLVAVSTASADQAVQPSAAAKQAYGVHNAAAQAAADGIGKNLLNLCSIKPQGLPRGAPRGVKDGAGYLAEPGQAFDELFYVGLAGVSAWAIKTAEGIILIDALNRSTDAKVTLLPGLRKMGLDPAQIKHLVITHGHGDHFGAAAYLQQHIPGLKVYASEADWTLMEGPSPFPNAPKREAPKRDQLVSDGQQLTLGDTTITLYITPGHTPGTLSLLIPVHDKGQPHVAALWGGTGFNFKPTRENFTLYADSAQRFSTLARQAGADVVLSNHPQIDATHENLEVLRAGGANPYVIGADSVAGFFRVAQECALARGALIP